MSQKKIENGYFKALKQRIKERKKDNMLKRESKDWIYYNEADMFISKKHLEVPYIRYAVPIIMNNFSYDKVKKKRFISKLLMSHDNMMKLPEKTLNRISKNFIIPRELEPRDIAQTSRIDMGFKTYEELYEYIDSNISAQAKSEEFLDPPFDHPKPRRPLVR